MGSGPGRGCPCLYLVLGEVGLTPSPDPDSGPPVEEETRSPKGTFLPDSLQGWTSLNILNPTFSTVSGGRPLRKDVPTSEYPNLLPRDP